MRVVTENKSSVCIAIVARTDWHHGISLNAGLGRDLPKVQLYLTRSIGGRGFYFTWDLIHGTFHLTLS